MPLSLINWEKSCTCRRSCRVNSCDQHVRHLRFTKVTRVYTCVYAKHAKCTLRLWVLVQLVYALIAGHKRYLWLASIQSETSIYREYIWTQKQCVNFTVHFQQILSRIFSLTFVLNILMNTKFTSVWKNDIKVSLFWYSCVKAQTFLKENCAKTCVFLDIGIHNARWATAQIKKLV